MVEPHFRHQFQGAHPELTSGGPINLPDLMKPKNP